MTIAEIKSRIEEKHVKISNENNTCDGIICGDVNQECSGVVLTCCPTVAVIKRAVEIGANFIICHEPTFYHGYDEKDWLKGTDILRKKLALIDANGIVIYRDHDHVHQEEPDMIYSGIVKKLGWETYSMDKSFFPISGYLIPETTLKDLGRFIAKKLNIKGLRFVGQPDMKVRKVGLTAHFLGGETDQECIREIEKRDYDVVLPLETVDWTIVEYVLDCNATGKQRGILNAGHFNLEEPGMEFMQEWVSEIVDGKVPVSFIQSGNYFDWIDCDHREQSGE